MWHLLTGQQVRTHSAAGGCKEVPHLCTHAWLLLLLPLLCLLLTGRLWGHLLSQHRVFGHCLACQEVGACASLGCGQEMPHQVLLVHLLLLHICLVIAQQGVAGQRLASQQAGPHPTARGAEEILHIPCQALLHGSSPPIQGSACWCTCSRAHLLPLLLLLLLLLLQGGLPHGVQGHPLTGMECSTRHTA
jgi:hypothetical protein